jgi:hypothetical protein
LALRLLALIVLLDLAVSRDGHRTCLAEAASTRPQSSGILGNRHQSARRCCRPQPVAQRDARSCWEPALPCSPLARPSAR